ncbi:hypothetical protein OH738_10195 [Streptomyces hirsutus]|uniref:Uncharacterized protein n=1 Tax=Streptomyces hirsutus TaxID=35620 RepID=A0ABZ1GWI8_9ACTN|nr:hypothetical protein [Streptomyces hirsutus]WSD09439.1 hypothetical protein OIE73_29270 [Streptomyces hirsutus]WTD17109.1 hypothetical protein OH738_10195 [Streptomyces hirsutus]
MLRHLQDAAPGELSRVKAIADRSQHEYGGSPAPLIVTVDTENAPEYARTLVDQLATTVRLATLAEMPKHLPSLITRVLGSMRGPERGTTFSSEALQLLMR